MGRRTHLATRRSILRAGGVSLVAGLAGCNQSAPSGQSSTTSAVESDVVSSIDFDVQDLVVTLVDGHDVSQVNLIDPNGELYRQASVATGATTVRMQILAVDLSSGGYSHYSPGSYKLVLKRDGGTDSVRLNLSPSLDITDVEQYRGGRSKKDLGRLIVTVVNNGSAPTWVYDLAYSGAPYYAASESLTGNPGTILFENVESPSDIVIPPGQTRKYLSVDYPLVFRENNGNRCRDVSLDLSILAGIAAGGMVSQPIRVTRGGESYSVSSLGHFVCSEERIQIDLEDS